MTLRRFGLGLGLAAATSLSAGLFTVLLPNASAGAIGMPTEVRCIAATTGNQGPTGPTGDTGATGPEGAKGATGASEPAFGGPARRVHALVVAGDVSYPNCVDLPGVCADVSDGAPGTQGATGPSGPAGSNGPDGDTGLTLENGPGRAVHGLGSPLECDGVPNECIYPVRGPQGAVGLTGSTGLPGPIGPKGDTGEKLVLNGPRRTQHVAPAGIIYDAGQPVYLALCKLPETGSNSVSWLPFGVALAGAGVLAYAVSRRRRVSI